MCISLHAIRNSQRKSLSLSLYAERAEQSAGVVISQDAKSVGTQPSTGSARHGDRNEHGTAQGVSLGWRDTHQIFPANTVHFESWLRDISQETDYAESVRSCRVFTPAECHKYGTIQQRHGGVGVPVGLTVFKTAGGSLGAVPGGFDSHTPLPSDCMILRRCSPIWFIFYGYKKSRTTPFHQPEMLRLWHTCQEKLSVFVRIFVMIVGLVLDRDQNAARNILEKALSSTRGCTEGHRKQTGLPRETLLDRGPLLLDRKGNGKPPG